MSEPLFWDANEALARAYSMQASIGLRSRNALSLMQQKQISTETAPPFPHPDLNASDWLAQSVFTISTARRALDQYQRDLLDAWYLPRLNDMWEARKENHLILFAGYYADNILDVDVSRWFVIDVARRWCGMPKQHPLYHWVQRTGKSERTLRTIANGTKKQQGLKTKFHVELESAKARVSDALFEEGIVYA